MYIIIIKIIFYQIYWNTWQKIQMLENINLEKEYLEIFNEINILNNIEKKTQQIDYNFSNFIDFLKSNELFFISKEYVDFYELDESKIHSHDKIHKSLKWGIYLSKYTKYVYEMYKEFIYFTNTYDKTLRIYKYTYYFLSKYNKKFKYGRNIWKELYSYNIFTINKYKKKTRLTLKKLNLLYLNLSAGMASKKLEMIEKRQKKSHKLNLIMIKSVMTSLKKANKLNKIIIQFKGTKSDFFNNSKCVSLFFNKNIDVYFIYTPMIPNKYIFKKIRSLKKNFRKSYLKM